MKAFVNVGALLAAIAVSLAGCGSDPPSQPAPQQYALSVTGGGNGAGTITSTPAGISCPGTCSAIFAAGTMVTLTAQAAAGSTLNAWSGGGCSGFGPCSVTLNAATTVTATFQLQSYSVSGTATGVVGSGCVLQLNGGNNFAVTGNGGFTFANPLLHGTGYAATILSQPVGPTQFCTLADASGTIAAANVSNIGLSCTVSRPACATATNLGTIAGDTASPMFSASGLGERWFRLTLREDRAANLPLGARIELVMPAGVDYDLFVYCGACGTTAVLSSTEGPGLSDVVLPGWNDDVGEDDTFDVLLQVRYVSGASPSVWNLFVLGGGPVGTFSCDP